jgi:ferritin-like metal-binding protein YciE
MKTKTLEDVFHDELHDIYSAESQIMKALPEMIDAASTEDLTEAFREHLDMTREQVRRLERVFEKIGEKPGDDTCDGMRGLIKEGSKIMKRIEPSHVLDTALIGAAQKVEHYQISAYGTLRALAAMLGQDEVAELLEQTLEEEKVTDENLTVIAESIMTYGELAEDDEEVEDEEEEVS